MEQKSQTTLLEEFQTLDKEDAGLLFRAEKERKKETNCVNWANQICLPQILWVT